MTPFLLIGGIMLLAFALLKLYRLPQIKLSDSITDEEFGQNFFPKEQAAIATQVRRILAEITGDDCSRIGPESRLAEDVGFGGGVDSLDSVEFMMALEDYFGTEFSENDWVEAITVRDLVNIIAAKKVFLEPGRRKLGQAVEKQFGIQCSPDELASLNTPAALTDLIGEKVKPQTRPDAGCESQQAFYLLRRALLEMNCAPRKAIRPDIPIRRLLRSRNVTRQWEALRIAVQARKWPQLAAPTWLRWCTWKVPLVLFLVLTFGLPKLNQATGGRNVWLGFLAELPWLAGLVVMVVSLILILRARQRCAYAIPPEIKFLRDLVPFVMTSEGIRWTPAQIAAVVQSIFLERLKIDETRYRDHADLVNDLGLESRWPASETGVAAVKQQADPPLSMHAS